MLDCTAIGIGRLCHSISGIKLAFSHNKVTYCLQIVITSSSKIIYFAVHQHQMRQLVETTNKQQVNYTTKPCDLLQTDCVCTLEAEKYTSSNVPTVIFPLIFSGFNWISAMAAKGIPQLATIVILRQQSTVNEIKINTC